MSDTYEGNHDDCDIDVSHSHPGETVETIDLTPTWQGILPGLIAMLDNGTVESRKAAESELRKMARLADYARDQLSA